MNIRHIPSKSNPRWTGPYAGELQGILRKTFNVDLDKNDGAIQLSQRLARIEDSGEFTGIDAPITAFLRTNADSTDRYWALSFKDGLLKTDSSTPENAASPALDWDTDGLDSSPAVPLDFTVHLNDSRNDSGKNKMFVTTDTGGIAVLNDCGQSNWNKNFGAIVLDTTVPFHPIEYFPLVKKTIVGNGNRLNTISRLTDTQNDTVIETNRIVFPNNLVARHIFMTTNRSWTLAYNKFGGGMAIEWDGSLQTYNDIHNLYGAPIGGVNYQETPIILNSNGVFLEFTGRGFSPMIRNGQRVALPINEDRGNGLMSIATADTNLIFAAGPRCMTVGEDGLIYINLGAAVGATQYLDRYTAGIWCLNPVSGRLYNKYSIGRWGDSLDYGHQLRPNSGLGGGGIYWVPSNVTPRGILAGGIISTSNGGSFENQMGIWLLDGPDGTTFTRGHFVTQHMQADDVREFFDILWVKFRKFVSSSARIIIKAKGTNSLIEGASRLPLSKTITWTSTTTFTVTLAAADDQLAVGDEVEMQSGANAGFLAHITAISGAHAAMQTITIDETVTTAGSEVSRARFDRWKKIGVVSSTTTYEQMMNIGIDSGFIQFKVELRGADREVEVNKLIVTSKPSITLNK